MVKRLPLIAVLGAVLLATTACGPIAGPTSSPTDTSSPSPTSSEPSATPTAEPGAGGTITAGNCTAADEAAFAHGQTQATMYTVYTDDASTPVTIQYMAFNHDGTRPVETLTTHGPLVNIISYPCTDAQDQANWTVSVTTTTHMNAACVIYFGGQAVSAEVTTYEDIGTASCSGNPGR